MPAELFGRLAVARTCLLCVCTVQGSPKDLKGGYLWILRFPLSGSLLLRILPTSFHVIEALIFVLYHLEPKRPQPSLWAQLLCAAQTGGTSPGDKT